MAVYRVPYIANNGSRRIVRVHAQSTDEAIARSGLDGASIVHSSVGEDYLAFILDKIRSPAPKIDEQIMLLEMLASAIETGRSPSHVIRDIVKGYDTINPSEEELSRASRASEILRACRITPSAVTLAEIGEHSNATSDSLRTAASGMAEMQAVRSEMFKSFSKGGLWLVVGVIAIIAIPLIGAYVIEQFNSAGSGIADKMATVWHWTDIMLFLNFLYTSMWPVLLAGLGGLVFLAPTFWNGLRKAPGFHRVDELIQLNRGLLFVSAFEPMYEAGITAPQAIRYLKRESGGGLASAYTELQAMLDRGESLSVALKSSEQWPEVLRMGFSGFESADPVGRKRIFENLKRTLSKQRDHVGSKVAKLGIYIGLTVVIFAFLLMVLGMYMPMMGMMGNMM